ncbi:hypothetical protein OEA41_001522 [Lepraria neglecta]|uniref:Uncharacterized protein n=1 Tax=Lepraria neglecta TaxID=209136 RepID=A0AAD9ZAU0_9LECA|nr:hypothetical protein OEA41_001522 [Lepraria neglecta]
MTQVRLKRTKSRQKRKRPKTYTFFIDTNPLFYIISYIVYLAYDDEAYRFPNTTPRTVLMLGVREGLNYQPIPWKEEMIDVPVFRVPVPTSDGMRTSPDEALLYGKLYDRLIDPRRSKRVTDEQKEGIRQDAEIKELIDRRDQLYKKIRNDFDFLYRVEGKPIYDRYEETKHAIDRLLKARKRELKKQIQVDFDAIVPIQDIRA